MRPSSGERRLGRGGRLTAIRLMLVAVSAWGPLGLTTAARAQQPITFEEVAQICANYPAYYGRIQAPDWTAAAAAVQAQLTALEAARDAAVQAAGSNPTTTQRLAVGAAEEALEDAQLDARAVEACTALELNPDWLVEFCASTSTPFDRPFVHVEEVSLCQRRVPLSAPPPQVGVRLAPPAIEASIITGFSDFLVDRAEAEVSTFLIESLGQRFCSNTDLARLFTNTCRVLSDTAGTLPPSLAVLGRAARDDIEALPQWLSREILIHFDTPEARTFVCVLDVAQSALRGLVDGVDAVQLLTEPALLLEHAYYPHADDAATTVDEATLCQAERDRIETLARLIGEVHRTGGRGGLSAILSEGRTRAAISVTVQDTSRPADVRRLDADAQRDADAVLRALRTLVATVENASHGDTEQRVAQLLAAAARLVGSVAMFIEPNNALWVTDFDDVADAIADRDYPQIFVRLMRFAPVQQALERRELGEVRRFVSLAAELATAESSEEVSQALDTAAEPLGSWRRKHEHRLSLTISGLVGFHPAFEAPLGNGSSDLRLTSGLTLAPLAMVGVDVMHGVDAHGWRVGAFISLIDVGAIASARLRFSEPSMTETEAEIAPELGLLQVVSPGAYFVIGLGRSPFTIGLGASIVPALRAADVTADPMTPSEVEPFTVVRVGGFLSVDVTIFPLL